jgi:hypothetical protein
MVIALLLTYLLVPQLKALLSLDIIFNPFTDIHLLAFLLIITGLVSILAGIYPAVILSGFQPVMALKNKVLSSGGSIFSLRRSLIVVQFAIAQLLIICTIVVSGQLEYFRSKPLGFNKNAIITVPFPPGNKPETTSSLRNQLEQITGIKQVSFGNRTPSSTSQSWSPFKVEGNPKEFYSQHMGIDHNYLQTYGLTLVAGHALTPTSDSSQILVNETLLGWVGLSNPEKAIGLRLTMHDKTYQIAGVVKDFYTGTLHKGINGIIMRKAPFVGMASVKLASADMRSTIEQIEQLWKKTYPESVFEFQFLDETIALFYREEVKMFKLFRAFSGIAIFISCLGLYGLVSYMAEQRTKEIGIRKVLGASMAHIVGLFTKEFFILIGIAFLLAAPLAWYAMHTWLQDFENRLPLGAGSFITAILFSLLIAGITVAYRSIRAALVNPVKSLRNE